MHRAKVVNLGPVRDLLAQWEEVRSYILNGSVAAFDVTIRDSKGQDTIFLGGAFRDDPVESLKATLRMSAARTRLEDPPEQAARWANNK